MMNYFFYKDYMFNKLIKHSDPLWIASIMVSVLEFFNALAIFLVISKIFFDINATAAQVVSVFIGIGIVLFVVNARYYIKNEKRICEKYQGESLFINIVGYIFYIVYYIGSIALIFVLKEKLGYHL